MRMMRSVLWLTMLMISGCSESAAAPETKQTLPATGNKPDAGSRLTPGAGAAGMVAGGAAAAGASAGTAAPGAQQDAGAGLMPAPDSGSGDAGLAMTPAPDGSSPEPAVVPPAGAQVTYHRDIRPLMQARCVGCHVEGGSGPMPLDSRASVAPYAALVVDAVSTRRMPPWLADSTNCRKLRHDQRLTDAQLMLFADWQDAGFPEGDAIEFEPLVDEPVPELGEPTIVASPALPYQLQPSTEVYVCLQLDVEFAQDTYVTAMDMLPQNAAYVHHVIVSSGSGVCSALGTRAENIFSYRPGSKTLVFEEGDALLIPAGSRLAAQFHYNTLFDDGASDALPADQSAFRMWTLPPGQTPQRVITRYPFHDFTIDIPVGATDATAGGSLPMSTANRPPGGGGWAPAEIIGVTPHMHVIGSAFKETLQRADGTQVCLIDVPDWDWNWQLDYFFAPDEVVPIEQTDQLIQECRYSNTPDDQLVVDGQRVAPRHTTFGEGSRDEMCLGYLWFRYDRSVLP